MGARVIYEEPDTNQRFLAKVVGIHKDAQRRAVAYDLDRAPTQLMTPSSASTDPLPAADYDAALPTERKIGDKVQM